MNDIITAEAAEMHGLAMFNDYSVLDVARIAASCPGRTHKDRVIDALRLLAAAEELADPWSHQYAKTDADRKHQRKAELIEELLASCTDEKGWINRRKLCLAAGKRITGATSPDTADRNHDRWLLAASEEYHRWKLAMKFYESESDSDAVMKKVDAARSKITEKRRKVEVQELEEHFETTIGQEVFFREGGLARCFLQGEVPKFKGFIDMLESKPTPKQTTKKAPRDATTGRHRKRKNAGA